MHHAYPLLLDLSDRVIVIIGGGTVAARKATGVLAAGARRVRCVALGFGPDLPAGVERIMQAYTSLHLDGAGLVFAATDRPDVNDAVVRDCRVRGILVNRTDSDDVEPSDFVTPAKFEEGAVIVAVSAGSAALSAALRDHLALVIDRRYIRMAEAMKVLRPAVKAVQEIEPGTRARIFRDLATEEALAVLEAGGIEKLRGWIEGKYPDLNQLTHG